MRVYQPAVQAKSYHPFATMKKALRSSFGYADVSQGVPIWIDGAARDDAQIQQDVMDELRLESTIEAASIGVEVKNGIATLTGRVDGHGEKWLIEAAARRIAGVQGLAVMLEIIESEPGVRTDDDIRRDCEHALGMTDLAAHQAIKVMVSNGWVTLSGEVKWGYERWTAEEIVGNLPGVTGINGQITVRHPVAGSEVNANIKAALYRQPNRQFHEVEFKVDRDQVTLSGTVHSLAGRRAVRYAALSTPGVNEVIDRTVLV
jgi:osmotically-inducible protein OsmY